MNNEIKNNKRKSVIPRPLQKSYSHGTLRCADDGKICDLIDESRNKNVTKAPNYIQGPFNPHIVGQKEKVEKVKHNSAPSNCSKSKHEKNKDNSIVANLDRDCSKDVREKRKHNSDSSMTPFNTGPISITSDIFSAKRNFSTEEKKRRNPRCTTEFSNKPDTNFIKEPHNFKKPIIFNAKLRSQSNKEKYEELVKEVTFLGECKDTNEKEKNQLKKIFEAQKLEIVDLKEELSKISLICKEKDEKQKLYSETIETQAHAFNCKERKLEERLKCSLEKLQELHIDPITLKSIDVDKEEISNNSSVKACNLYEKLQKSNKRNLEMIFYLKEQIEKVNLAAVH